MLTILMVFVSGVWHPTYAWHNDERYQSAELYTAPAPKGLSARKACQLSLLRHQWLFPNLTMKCVEQT